MNAGGSSTDRRPDPDPGGRRRPKAALFLVACGLAGLAPHTLAPGLRLLPASLLALVLGGHGLVTVVRGLRSLPAGPAGDPLTPASAPPPAPPAPQEAAAVDVVVAARDEQAVIARLVERVGALQWPENLLRLWVIDDGSVIEPVVAGATAGAAANDPTASREAVRARSPRRRDEGAIS